MLAFYKRPGPSGDSLLLGYASRQEIEPGKSRMAILPNPTSQRKQKGYILSTLNLSGRLRMDSVWTLYFDGSSFGKGRRGGPGPSAGAAVIISSQGETLVSSVYVPRSDSDTAEYWGLICGLEKAQQAGVKNLLIKGDSRNVVDQISGRKILRKKELLALNAQASELLSNFQNWTIEWIPRGKNELADSAAKACIDRARSR